MGTEENKAEQKRSSWNRGAAAGTGRVARTEEQQMEQRSS